MGLVGADAFLEIFDRGEAIFLLGGHRPQGDELELAFVADAVDRVLGGIHQALHDVAARVGRFATDDLVEDRAEQVDVAGEVDVLDWAAGHLGGHVGGRAAQAIGLEDRVGVGERHRDPREAPVHDEDLAIVAEHHVFGFQVAVDDAVGMGEGYRVGHAEQDAQVVVE